MKIFVGGELLLGSQALAASQGEPTGPQAAMESTWVGQHDSDESATVFRNVGLQSCSNVRSVTLSVLTV